MKTTKFEMLVAYICTHILQFKYKSSSETSYLRSVLGFKLDPSFRKWCILAVGCSQALKVLQLLASVNIKNNEVREIRLQPLNSAVESKSSFSFMYSPIYWLWMIYVTENDNQKGLKNNFMIFSPR